MKKRFIASLILALVLAFSFGFSACGETSATPETPHEHSWSTEWTKNDIYHWHAPLCADTAEVKGRAEHDLVDNTCLVCGYHKHTWSTEWSTDNLYHWHAPLCDDTDDTTELKDKSLHSFSKVNGILTSMCSECGYKRFNDVGEKYYTVVKPIYEVAETILNDLIQSGEVELEEWRNPRITEVQYINLNGSWSFEIIILKDVYIVENGEKSEFLQKEIDIVLKNFGGTDSEAYLAYRDFLQTENESQNLSNYEEILLPYAQKCADIILAQYEIYKNSSEREIYLPNRPKQINLSADSSLSETYEKIVANFNSVLEVLGYPLITNQVLNIQFGRNIKENGNYELVIKVSVGIMFYIFYLSFNENGEFSEEYLLHLKGTLRAGYEWSDPDWYNPTNEEYAEFFEHLKIEEYDLSDIKDSYGYDGVGCAFFCPYVQVSNVYF